MAPELRPAAAGGRAPSPSNCWRPLPDPPRPCRGTGPGRSHDRRGSAGSPRIQPVAAERFTGLLGVRRPGDWTGRLAALPDTEPIDDEAFVKAWGTLPEEPLTLCGTSRFDRDLAVELRTGPSPPRSLDPPRRADPDRVRPDRRGGRRRHPRGLRPIPRSWRPSSRGASRLTQVSGDGLIDWTVSADRRLHLTWQRRGARSAQAPAHPRLDPPGRRSAPDRRPARIGFVRPGSAGRAPR